MLSPISCFDCGRDMVEYTKPEYSRREVIDAGKALAGVISPGPDAIEIFRIAHNWRSSFAYPMHRLRHDLAGKVRREGGSGVTAARLKRMQSIRSKLGRLNLNLYGMQDIGGCRAIVRSIPKVNKVVGFYDEGDCQHRLHKKNDYILEPKKSGYRGIHLIFKYNGQEDDSIYNRQFIEIQVRTQLQHAWATAVEAVGMVRRESLKSSLGSEMWLRFFQLISAEFAIREKTPVSSLAPQNKHERIDELIELDNCLDAVRTLSAYNEMINFTEHAFRMSRGYFIIRFDVEAGTVHVVPFNRFSDGGPAFDEMEKLDRGGEAVLVEVDRVQDLKAAYPNYFMDVGLFVRVAKETLSYVGNAPEGRSSSWLKNLRRMRRERPPINLNFD